MTEHGKEQRAHAPASPFIHPTSSASQSPSQVNAQPEMLVLPYVISLPLLLQQPLVEPGWIVPGILPVGVSLLAGTPRVDKALLANQLGLSVAAGTPFLRRFPTRQGRVLYLALADSDVHVRTRALGLLNEQSSPEHFHVAFQWSPFRQGGLADLEDTLSRLEGTRLVIVDPLEFVQPLRGESYGYRGRPVVPVAPEAALTFFVPLRELARRYDLAILLLHHLADDWSGSRRDPLAGLSPTGLTAASACNLLLTANSSSPRTCELHVAGLHVPERRLPLTYDSEHGEWRLEER